LFLLDSRGGDFVYSTLCSRLVSGKEFSVRGIILGTVFALFIICFVAIIIEETFLGGRRRRKMERALKERRRENNTGC
jgi:hypothetical protein